MYIRIESPDNAKLKLVRKLQTRKGRSAEGKFVVEGINLVREIIDRKISADFIVVSDDFNNDYIRSFAAHNEIPVCEVPSPIFNKLTDADFGAGVLAVAQMPSYDLQYVERIPRETNILVLDRIQDPGNMGTMVRTAVAAGYGMVLAIKGTVDMYSPKVLRSTAGMIFEMPVLYVNDAEEVASIVHKTGRKLVVTTPASGKPYYEENLKIGTALVIGNEGNGISNEMIALADLRVTLPMHGNIESLNAAVSASILMYEAVRG